MRWELWELRLGEKQAPSQEGLGSQARALGIILRVARSQERVLSKSVLGCGVSGRNREAEVMGLVSVDFCGARPFIVLFNP